MGGRLISASRPKIRFRLHQDRQGSARRQGLREISEEINNKDWRGVLTCDKIWNGLQDDYRQDNINIEFDIKYVLED